MTEQEVRSKSAEICVREAKLEAEAAAIREQIGELQSKLNTLEVTRAQIRIEEAELYASFTASVVNG